MALSEIRASGRWNAQMYTVLRRFLDSNIGKRWSEVYSKICDVADANTHLGNELRRAVAREVDQVEDDGGRYCNNDWYIDDRGLLQKRPERSSWKRCWQERTIRNPIRYIYFLDDGNDYWYQLVDVANKNAWAKTKKTPRWVWFQFTRTRVREVMPTYDNEHDAIANGIGQPRKPTGYKEWFREEIHSRQCNSKELKLLRPIANRTGKIVKLKCPSHDRPDVIAYVAGKSRKK